MSLFDGKFCEQDDDNEHFSSLEQEIARLKADIAKRDAVIAKKDEALNAVNDSQLLFGSTTLHDEVSNQVYNALAITADNVRLVEAGNVETLGCYPDTSQQICYLKIRANNGTKLYTIEVRE